MWLLCEDGKREGAYAVKDINNNKVLFLFEQEDDAERYRMQLESEEDAIMEVVEVDEDVAIKACEMYNYKYTVITTNDFVIPPKHVFVQCEMLLDYDRTAGNSAKCNRGAKRVIGEPDGIAKLSGYVSFS